MLYQLFQAHADMAVPVRMAAGLWSEWLRQSQSLFADPDDWRRRMAAACEVVTRTSVTHARLPFGIDSVQVGNERVAVTEAVVDSTPFATLLHFAKDTGAPQPKLLVVAPMSGHFATLLRGTVRTALADNDVYLTDWHNARDVSTADGQFDFDDFTDHVIRFLERLGPDSHVLAVCQPTVAVLMAVALMAQAGNPAQPRSMTLMAGPIDTRISPTAVNDLAKQHSYDWFERNLICRVPLRYAGAGRRVYPGFLQLTAFMAMNKARHEQAFRDYHANLVAGEASKAAVHEAFYDEYFAVMDMTAEFYLDTIAKVFQQHELPRGVMRFRDQLVEPAAIRRTAMLTVEGELDDICAIGQTMAAHDLCTGLRPGMKRHHLQTGVGHYGVFNGRRWTNSIYPQVRDLIQSHAA
ncbi:MAG: polyhydroxyalkanoate depolymerase [Acetobacteraceae bacterium]